MAYQVLIVHQAQEFDDQRRNQLVVARAGIDEGVSNSRGNDSPVARTGTKELLENGQLDLLLTGLGSLPGAGARIWQEQSW
jgi:hypothetical protein